jgi:hypothetical protein
MVDGSPRGQHHAFEPLPWCAHKLRSDFPDVNVHQVALGEVSGDFEFYYTPDHPGFRVQRLDDVT